MGPPTPICEEPEQAHSQTDTVSNVLPKPNIVTVLPDYIPKGEVSTHKALLQPREAQ